MKHDEIIAMAIAEGLSFVPEANSPLVRIVQKAVQVEREACAKVCEGFAQRTLDAQSPMKHDESNVMLRQIAVLGHGEAAKAIRARGAA